MTKRIKIKGERLKELDYDAIAYVLHTMARRQVEARRKAAAVDKEKREVRKEHV